MEAGLRVQKYMVAATFRENTVDWCFLIETDGGQRFDMPVRDGAEIPLLLDIVRRDRTVFFDPRTRRLSTSWSDPGAGQ